MGWPAFIVENPRNCMFSMKRALNAMHGTHAVSLIAALQQFAYIADNKNKKIRERPVGPSVKGP
jgi:hypothetical protein